MHRHKTAFQQHSISSETSLDNIVIIGGGQAAVSAITSLRHHGYDGSITLVGDELFLPYQRPPLSKAYMKGELARERLFFKQAGWYDGQCVRLHVGTRVNAIDRTKKTIDTDSGKHFDYDALIVATGSRARRLQIPGVDLSKVFDLRTLADVEKIRPTIIKGNKIVVIGGGYIGLEAAAAARQIGVDVTVLEYAPRVLARVTSAVISEFYEKEHRANGIDIRTNARIAALRGTAGQVTGVELQDGSILATDAVLIGVGIVPNQELAEAAGIDCNDGIIVDRDARTSDPHVYAAGDCTRRPLVHYDGVSRLESVHNAVEQGKLAAAAILGKPRPAEECPWFWSDQFDLKLQIAGLSNSFDECFVRGEPDERKFAVFYFRSGNLIAVDAINSPQEFVIARKLIAAGQTVDKGLLADTSIPMKEVVGAER